jgi:hypothetical protein
MLSASMSMHVPRLPVHRTVRVDGRWLVIMLLWMLWGHCLSSSILTSLVEDKFLLVRLPDDALGAVHLDVGVLLL